MLNGIGLGRRFAKEVGNVSSTAIDWLKRRGLAEDLPEVGRCIRGRSAAGRLNAALSKWSVESAQTFERAPAKTAPLLVESSETVVAQVGEEAVPQNAEDALHANSQRHLVEETVKANGHKDSEEAEAPDVKAEADYYEQLQISRNADLETIHRVYRMMAFRFHPDNPKTGDFERFLLLKRAYEVLSDPSRRAEYDAAHENTDTQPLPIFELKDFVHGIQGEVNRRLGILSLLYHRRRMSETRAGISVMELEKRMAFPREHLNFTLWYLRAKGFVTLEENSDYSLTSAGVDYVEENSTSNRVIRQLLALGSGSAHDLGGAPGDGAGMTISGKPSNLVAMRARRGSLRVSSHRRAKRRTASLEQRSAV